MEEKKPRYILVDNYEPCGVMELEQVLECIRYSLTECTDNEAVSSFAVKRVDMTDEEYDAVPDE